MLARSKTLGTPEPGHSKACTLCRARKTKCDGARPQCGNCRRLAVNCYFSATDGRKHRPTKSDLDALRSQIVYLKSQLEDSQRTIESLQQAQFTIPTEDPLNGPSFPLANDIPRASVHQPAQKYGFDMGFDSLFSFSAGPMEPGDKACLQSPRVSHQDPLEALSSVMAQLHMDDISGESYYMGPTSNLHFLGYRPCRSSSSKAASLPSTYSLNSEVRSLSLPVPANNLAALFEAKVHPFFPLLNHFNTNGVGAISVIERSPFLYDQVLAIGAWCLHEKDEYYGYRDLCIESYSSRFSEHLSREINHVCLVNAQAFLLKSYLTTPNGELETATILLAISCAMLKRLGLHVDPLIHDPNGFALSQGTSAERAAIFWACFQMDRPVRSRQLALLEGRACYMPACDMPSCRPFDTIITNQSIGTDVGISPELINACHIEFLYLQDEVLREIHSFTTSVPRERVISEGHFRYMTWYQSMPPCILDMKHGRTYHPIFLSFHMTFYNGVILLHRPYLRNRGLARDTANQQCRESAFKITAILKVLTQSFGYLVSDFMVVYATLSAGLVHLVGLQSPDVTIYRRSVRALKSIVNILAKMTPYCGYAKVAFDDLRRLAVEWSLSPVNSPGFWQISTEMQVDESEIVI